MARHILLQTTVHEERASSIEHGRIGYYSMLVSICLSPPSVSGAAIHP